MTVRTRFAPSPTGFLHIGGARTALYCWLEARRRGGEFVLRIEDTDRQRSTEEAVQAILDGMQWLGLNHDDGPIFQTGRLERYKQVADELLKAGKAYYAYESKDEIEAMRNEAMAKGEKPRYNGYYRDRNEPYRDDPKRVIRFRNPTEGSVVFDDKVKGRVEWSNSELDDLVIFRSDGWPTYNFAVVVDDIDGQKLSKRHGAVSVMQYRDDGFLPHALLNYLVRLGWSHGDQEIFSAEEMVRLFDIGDVNKAASRFDLTKLSWLNQHYLKSEDPAAIAPEFEWHLTQAGIDFSKGPQPADVIVALRDRVQTLKEMAERAKIWYGPILEWDDKAVVKHLQNDSAVSVLEAAKSLLAVAEWTPEAIHQVIEQVAAKLELGMGKIAQPLRVAMTGTQVSPSIEHTIYLAGREEALKRVDDAIAKAKTKG
jgi:glutamyl-tRNA synthetase